MNVRTFAAGPLRLHVHRTAPGAHPLFLIYPLLGKHAFMVTVWRQRFEFRWARSAV